ncbi:MAG: FAD-dependent oxidoreductase [Proteobacteria bacterium]|nr:FAD-dependent oxidoreductase [Pseudomonadota bacterium]
MECDEPDVDVAIVGGGISGVYSGWRLLGGPLPAASLPASWAEGRCDRKLKVALFEGSDRIGGRLLSARSPHLPETTAEIGGMRYVAPAQRLVTGLIEKALNLSWHDQAVDVPGNIAFLRGRLLRTSDLGRPAALPYALDASEQAWLAARGGQSPAALIGRALQQLMPGIAEHLAGSTLREYLATVAIDRATGVPDLWHHGLWNLLAKMMSPDGYAGARATIGYDCLGGNYNALDLTAEYFNFTPEVSYRMVDAGYESVPWSLRTAFEAAGGETVLDHWLTGFERAAFADGSTGVRLVFRNGRTRLARALLLAMPRRSLELLRPEGPVLADPAFRRDLLSVSAVPLFKLFLLYRECWWQEAGVSKGRSLTDMPLRQCYYWLNGSDGRTVPHPNDPALVMAYDDLLNVTFWSGLDTRRHTAETGAVRPLFVGVPATAEVPDDPFGKRLRQNWEAHSATRTMVAEMHRQLKMMHGVDQAPEPVDAAYMDWSRDPYGGGVHFWNPNYESARLVRRMTQPVDDFPCYLCGEAYSTNQTWVEGALQTAEIVLQDRLGLHRAEWQDG